MNDLGDFSDLTDSAFEQERKKALAVTAPLAVSVASTKSPDAAAKAQALARRYNLPPLVVDHFAEDYAARAKQEDAEALMRKAPKLGSWIAEKPERADIVHDDLEGLAGIEQTIGKIGPMRGPAPSLSSVAKGIYESFGQGLSMAREGVRMQGADLLGFKVMGKDAARRFSQTQFEADTTTPEFDGATASGLYGGLTSTVRAVPSVAAAIAMRNPAVALGLMGVQTEAEAYGKYRTRGATPGMAAVGAIGEGAVEVATEMLPMGFLVEKFGKVGAKDFLKGLLGRELPTEQVATLLQDAIDTAVANPDKTWGEYLAERPEAAYKTLLATVVQSSVMGAANSAARRLGGQREQADEAEQFASQAEQLAGLLAASKTASRDATTLREFIAQVADEEGDAPTQFYVDGEQLLNVLNQSGMSRDEFAALAPTAAAQLDEALTGGVVRLPVAEFAAAGEKITAPLIDHLRASEDAPTRAEAREFMAGEGKALQEEVERELQKRGDDATFRDSVAGIKTRFEAELNAAGRFTPEVNKGYATLLSNFFGATAARLGMAPDELLAKYELRVQAKASDGKRVMNQVETDTPAFRNWFGDSKVRDAAGKPLVVYHWTGYDIAKFRKDVERTKNHRSPVFFFTNDTEIAAGYADSSPRTFDNDGKPLGQNILPVFLSIQNPLRIEGDGETGLGKLLDDAAIKRAMRDGYDGIVATNVIDAPNTRLMRPQDVYIAFRPEQIKSATGNRGTFDPADPNILNQDPKAAEERKAKIIELRKRESILKSLQECMA